MERPNPLEAETVAIEALMMAAKLGDMETRVKAASALLSHVEHLEMLASIPDPVFETESED